MLSLNRAFTFKNIKQPSDDCVDINESCLYWSEIGQCDKNPDYMLVNCKKSCKVCQDGQGGQGKGIFNCMRCMLLICSKNRVYNMIDPNNFKLNMICLSSMYYNTECNIIRVNPAT